MMTTMGKISFTVTSPPTTFKAKTAATTTSATCSSAGEPIPMSPVTHTRIGSSPMATAIA